MSRRQTVLIALVLALLFAGGLAIYAAIAPDNDTASAPGAAERRPSASASKEATAAAGVRPAFDILRISPSGQSVFAGRAEPGADVVVLAGEREIARTRADADGSWSIVVENAYDGGDVAFRIRATKDGKFMLSDAVAMAVPKTPDKVETSMRVASAAKPPAASPRAKEQQKADSRHLESLVNEVRSNPDAANNPAKAPAVIPVPVTFETGDTTFTPEGRRAASLLVEYLKGAGLTSVTLSGHADERGPDAYNMHLSRRRLEAIAQYLREHGFEGKLTLLAMGKREPYAAVDRSHMPMAELWRLDRRVELRTR
jgi:outer membrane protein OmpA-like peptidoglycan-associated protein